MGNATRKSAYRLHFLGMTELFLQRVVFGYIPKLPDYHGNSAGIVEIGQEWTSNTP